VTVDEILELAKSGTGPRTPLQRAIIELLETPSPAFPTIAADRRGGSVWIPREANRSYRPEHARQLALALLRGADVADEGKRPVAPAEEPVYYESAAHARLAHEQARLDREQRESIGAIVEGPDDDAPSAIGPAPESAASEAPIAQPAPTDKAPGKRDGGRGRRHG
jgi:hypothetical protein